MKQNDEQFVYMIRLYMNVGPALVIFESHISDELSDIEPAFHKFTDLTGTPFHMAELIAQDDNGGDKQIGCFVV